MRAQLIQYLDRLPFDLAMAAFSLQVQNEAVAGWKVNCGSGSPTQTAWIKQIPVKRAVFEFLLFVEVEVCQKARMLCGQHPPESFATCDPAGVDQRLYRVATDFCRRR